MEVQRSQPVTVIRRWAVLPTGERKLERYPASAYAALRSTPDELAKFVIRLNERVNIEDRTKQAVEIKHAFISVEMLDEYQDFLKAQIPSRKISLCEYHYLTKYFLHFFIGQMNMPDPLEWHKHQKTVWANYLLSKDVPGAARTKRNIIQAANRFMKWLHERLPAEVPPLKFEPISKAVFRDLEAGRVMRGESRIPQPIPEADFKRICEAVPPTILPAVMLAWCYGLRRAETLGVNGADVRQGYLSVERQRVTIESYGPLKGREARRVPHWYSSPAEAFAWASSIPLIHPDTLTQIWTEALNTLGMSYTFHDLRHSFISRAMQDQPIPRDVQLAVGHKNIETTMGYAHDIRSLDDRPFKVGV